MSVGATSDEKLGGQDTGMSFKQTRTSSKNDRIQRLLPDITGALVASAAVTPVVGLIDTAVTEVAFGLRSLQASVKFTFQGLVFRPYQVLTSRPFAAIFFLYAGTYVVANVSDTVIAEQDGSVGGITQSNLTKLGAVTAANGMLSLYKDAQFARAYGVGGPRSLPLAVYTPWIIRDAITLFATFNLPPLIASSFPDALERVTDRMSAAQLLAPAASQIVVTPLHLVGLDIYNRAGRRVSMRDQWLQIRRAWASTSVARMIRVLPGLGIGNVLNTKTRQGMIDRIESQQRLK